MDHEDVCPPKDPDEHLGLRPSGSEEDGLS